MNRVLSWICVLLLLFGISSVYADEHIGLGSTQIMLTNGMANPEGLTLTQQKEGRCWTSRLTNDSTSDYRIKEVMLAEFSHCFPTDSQFYGEGFSMTTGSFGTLGKFVKKLA